MTDLLAQLIVFALCFAAAWWAFCTKRIQDEQARRLRELEAIQGALAHAVAQMQRDRDATLWVDRDGIVHRGNE